MSGTALNLLTLGELRARDNYKWSAYPDDVIPAWVADMDFPAAEPIRDALVDFFARGDLGYFNEEIFDELRQLCAVWQRDRFGWPVGAGQVELVSDSVQSLHLMVQHLTHPGDGVAILTPSYHHFFAAVTEHGRSPLQVELLDGPEGWEIDFDRLEVVLAQPRTRLLLLCNPHNPTGRVFTRTELEALAELALRHGVWIASDELHADLVYEGCSHLPIAALSTEVAERTVTLTAASKPFNIAGTHLGFLIYGTERLRRALPPMPSRAYGKPGITGCIATRTAWLQGADWLAETLAYLQSNRDHLLARLAEQAPWIRVHRPEATYLAWLDLSVRTADAAGYLLNRARVALSGGAEFGWPPGTGEQFARLNFATSRVVLDQIVDRIVAASPGQVI